MGAAIIKCGECESKFDVSGLVAGTTIRCGHCKALLEVPPIAGTRAAKSPAEGERPVPAASRVAGGEKPPPAVPSRSKEEAPARAEREKARSGTVPAARDGEARKAGEKTDKNRPVDGADRGGRTDRVARSERAGERTDRQKRPGEGTDKNRRPAEERKKTTRRVASLPEEGRKKKTPWAVYAAAGGVAVAALAGFALFGRGPAPARDTPAAPKTSPLLEELRSRQDKAGSDPDRLWELTRWCEANKLKEQREKLLARIVELEPRHARAQAALGRVEHEGQWISREKLDAILTEQRSWRGPVESALGKGFLEERIERFDLCWQKKEGEDLEGVKAKLAEFSTQLGEYHKGFYERKKDELVSYSEGRYREAKDLPRLRVAVFTDTKAYQELAEKSYPEAKAERGFFDPKSRLLFLLRETHQYKAPFYDSFLFSVYRWHAERKERNKNEHVLWEKGLDSLDYVGIDVHVSLTDHFLVSVEQGKEYSATIIANDFAEMLETLWDTFAANFKEVVKTRAKMRMMPIYIFRERQGYLKYGERSNKLGLLQFAGGHYEPDKQIMMTFLEKGKSQAPTVLHEGTHLLMHYLAAYKPKRMDDLFWFQEGIADFHAGYTRDKDTGKLILGAPFRDRLERFQGKLLNGQFIPLKEFVQYSQTKWVQLLQRPEEAARKHWWMLLVYEQSWAFCHFLMHYDKGKYRQKFLCFIDKSIQAGSNASQSLADFMRCMGTIDFAQMEQEFKKFILDLKA